MSELTHLTLTGPPYDRGTIHGEQFAAEIRNNVEIYFDRFAYHGADEETVREQSEGYVSLVERENETYAEEMHGIAEGSGVPIEEIAMLNARYEIMYSAFSDEVEAQSTDPGRASPDGCTSFGVQPEFTADGHTRLGQNWDWIPAVASNTFVMDLRREDAPNMVALTEAGIAGGKMGINERGIGLVVNGLVTPEDGENPFRKPFHVRCREILDAERLDTAIEPIIVTDRACSANFLVGHAEGEMINIEAAPETANYLYPENGLLTHANHFEGGGVDSEFERIVPHTLCRSPRLKRLLSHHAGELDTDVATEVLCDHFNEPASICRHIDESLPERERVQSNASIVLDLTERAMLATNEPPCRTDYQRFEVTT